MKKKILSIALVVCLLATALVSGTLAYFTDEDNEANVFTIGNVEIDLQEDYTQNSALVPGININKDVRVENTGSEEAYVRIHLAIPTIMDDGDPSFNASHNFIHWNFSMDSVAAGEWSWIPENTEGTGYKGNGAGNWNFYTKTVDGVEYNVYVATYRTLLKAGETTKTDAITNVYLDATVDAEYIYDEDGTTVIKTKYVDTKGNEVELTPEQANNIKILVWAEGGQADGFSNAYEALNAQFGVPGTYNPWE